MPSRRSTANYGGNEDVSNEAAEYNPDSIAGRSETKKSAGTRNSDYSPYENTEAHGGANEVDEDDFVAQGKSTMCCGRMRTPAQYWRDLLTTWPPKFVAYLGIVYFFVKGLAFQALTASQLPIYKDKLTVGAVDYQRFTNVPNMAYGLKPLIGVISDVIPIMGYRKKFYAAIWSLFASVSVLGVIVLPQEPSSGALAATFFFLVVMGVAAMDLLCEGKYSELMARKPKQASSIATWSWGTFTLGSFIAACIEGPLADNVSVYVVLWICLPLLLIPFVPSLLGWIPEGKVVRGKEQRFDAGGLLGEGEEEGANEEEDKKMKSGDGGQLVPKGKCINLETLTHWSTQQKKVVVVGLLISVAALALAIISIVTDNTYITLGYVGSAIITLLICCHMLIPRPAAMAVTFFVFHNMAYLNIAGILDYWFTSDDDCVPDGPNFSYSYYQTFGGIMANVAGMVGLFCFEGKLNGWSYPKIFVLTTILKIIASFFDLCIVQRWNRDIGISDHVAFIFGDKIAFQVIQTLDFMPGVMLMSKVCPKGLESTMYALIAGFSNLGYTVSSTFGYMLAGALDVKKLSASESPTGEVYCNFDKLPELIIISHMALPLLTIPLAFVLLPKQSMKENIIGVDVADKRRRAVDANNNRSSDTMTTANEAEDPLATAQSMDTRNSLLASPTAEESKVVIPTTTTSE